MYEGLPAASAEQPLVPELEDYRTGFRWAKGEIRNLTGPLDEETYNRRPAPAAWSAAECVEHLSVTAREMIPPMESGIRAAREQGWLAHGPFEYGRFETWFARQTGGGQLPPRRRFKAPRLYRPPHIRYGKDAAVEEFLRLQDAYVEVLQLASGVDLARVKIPSPALSLLRLSLGRWLCAMEGHQRRHLWQARRAVTQES
jgi:hypothetical protein